MACPQCFRTFPDEIRFCGLCGIQLAPRTLTEPLAEPQPTEESSYLGSLIDGRYRINRLIGRGGMGSVFEVEHVHMRKVLAMKLLHEDMVVRKQLVGRFTREARAVSRLSNEHTVRVYDFGRHEALFFLVMEYLDGEDLEVLLSREGPLPWRKALRILDEVCESLGEAHGAGIIHRDLKPENIMLIERPDNPHYVKVLDFGLAKVTNVDDVFSVHSHRDLFGTPYYMSPEQIRSADMDHRADVYALGCLAFRVLTNQHVYNAPYAFDVLRQHLTAAIPSVCRNIPEAQVPPRVDRLVWRALAKRPEHRFPDTAAMREEIAGCLASPEGESLVVTASEREADPLPEIDADLEARLQAFEQSHQAAEARLRGDPVEDAPPPLPVGIAVEDTSENAPSATPTERELRLPDLPPELDEPLGDDESTEADPSTSETYDRTETVEMRVARSPRVQLPEDFIDPPPSFELMPSPVAAPPASPEPMAAPAPEIDYAAHLDSYDDPYLTDDTMGFARRLRWQRKWRTGLMLVVIGAVAVGGAIWWSTRPPAKQPAAEQEPNDSPTQANVIEQDTAITGYLGKRLATFDSDRDHFKLDMGGPGRYLELHLSQIPNLDLHVDILDRDGRTLATVDNAGLGKAERLRRFLVSGSEVILAVSESKAGDGRPTENVSDSYKLVATVTEALEGKGEVEPNNSAAEANAYRRGATYHGYLDGTKDVDYFRIGINGEADLRRWEFLVEAEGTLVPRITLSRWVGRDAIPVFSDEGGEGRLATVYEEPDFPNEEYVLAVQHSGRGSSHGAYKVTAHVREPKRRDAVEDDNDRARATRIAIGEEVHGVLEGGRDVDMFAIPVTDPKHRQIEVVIHSVVRDRVRLTLTDVHNAKNRSFPPPRTRGKRRVPQPTPLDRTPVRFKGDGERYYLKVSTRSTRDRNVGYTFRVKRIMDERIQPLVGGPGY